VNSVLCFQRGQEVAFGAYFDLLDTLGYTHVQREADSLGAVIDKNSADGVSEAVNEAIRSI
jgi:hypothetical protein